MGILRFLLAVSVVLFHANTFGFQFVGGGTAVEAFFLISGFYMSLVLDKKYTGINDRYRLFIGNRFLKLYPAYWTVLLLSLLMLLVVLLVTGHPILLLHQANTYKMQWPGIVFLSFTNLAILGQDLVSFLALDKASGALYFTPDFLKTFPEVYSFLVVPQAWSLSIEMMFYCVAPFLLRRKLWMILLLMGLILVMRFILMDRLALNYDPWVFRFFPSQLLLFLAGNLSYRLYTAIEGKIKISRPLVYTTLILLSLATVCYWYIPFWLYKRKYYLLMVFLALPVLIHASKFIKPDTYLGELSYPVYLSHMLALQTLSTLKSTTGLFKHTPLVIPTLVLTVLLSILINRYVVRPVDRFRQSRVAAG